MAICSSTIAWKIPWICCRKGDPFQGLKLGSCLTLRKELSEETHVLTRGFIGKENLGGEQEGKGTQENCSLRGSQSQVLW